jgi:hypothetical protein
MRWLRWNFSKKPCSILKKGTEKLLLLGARGPCRVGPPAPSSKRFLLLFSKIGLPSIHKKLK